MKTTRLTKSKLALLALPLIVGMGILGSQVADAATMVTNTNTAGGWITNAGSTNFWSGGTAFNNTNWSTAALGANYGVVFTNGSGNITNTTAIYLNALQYTPPSAGNFSILSVGTGTLNFTGANAFLNVGTGSGTLTIGSKVVAAANLAITNNASLILTNTLTVNTGMTATLTGSGTTTLTNAPAFSIASGANFIITNTYVSLATNYGSTFNLAAGGGTTTIANGAIFNAGPVNNGINVGANGTLIVSQGGVITNSSFKQSGASGNSLMILTNGGKYFGATSKDLVLGRQDSNNRILVGSTIAGSNSIWNGGASTLKIAAYGTYANGSSNNLVQINGGGLLTNINGAVVGGAGGTGTLTSIGNPLIANNNNQFVVANGGVVKNNANGAFIIGYSADNSNSIIVTDSGSLLDANGGNFNIGYQNSTWVNTITNLALAFTNTTTNNNYTPSTNNTLQVLSGGVLSNAGVVTIGGLASGSNSFNIYGGTAYVSGVNLGSTVTVTNLTSLGTNTPTYATNTYTNVGLLNLSNNGTTNGALIARANGNLIYGNGTVNLAGNGEIDAGGFVVTNTANVTGSGTLTVNGTASGNLGTGSLTLSGTNSFGGLNVAGGTLVAASSNALGAGVAAVSAGRLNVASTGVTNQINANGGTVNFSGAGVTNSAASVSLNTGGSLTVGSGGGNTLTLGTLTLNGGVLNLAVSNGLTSDLITTASFGITANSYVTLTGFASGNSYTILSNASGINLGSYSLIGTNMGHNAANFALDNTGTTITANITTVTTKWNGASSNWSAGWDTYVPTLAGDVAVLDATGAGNSSILVDTSAVVGSITLSNAAGYSIGSVTSSNLALNNGNNPSTVTVQDGNHTISEGTSITNGVLFSVTNASSLSMAGSITGSGGLSQAGQGTLVLGGSNSYLGATTVNGGTVVAANAKALGAGAGNLNVASGTLTNGYNISVGAVTLGNGTISGTGTLTGTSYIATNTGDALITQGLAGSAGFTNNGTGTTTLAGINTFTGNTAINGGSTVLLTGLLNNGAYNGTIALSGSTLILSNSSAQTLSNTVSGSGTLANVGTGGVTLGANNNFTNITINNAGTLTATNQFYMNGTNAPVVFNNTGAFNSTLSGQFRMQGGTNTMNLLAGTATFNGFNEGSAAGTNAINVNSGATMNLGNSMAVGYSGSVGSNVLTVNPGAVYNQTLGTLYINQAMFNGYAAVTNYGTMTLSGGSGISMNSQQGSNNTAVLIQAGGSFYNYTNIQIGGGTVGASQFLSNSSALVDVKGGTFSNAGTMTLGYQGFNTTNTFTVEGTGTATVGTLNLGSTTTLYTTGTATNSSGTLYTNTSYVTNINGLNFAAYVQAIYTNTSNASTFSSAVTNIYTNKNTVNLLSGGTLVVKGSISAGGMTVGTNATTNTVGIGSGLYTVNWNGGTLQAGASSANFFTNSPYTTVAIGSSNATFDVNGFSDTISQVLSGPGALRVTNSVGAQGTLTLSGTNTYQGGTVINGGTLAVANNSALGSGTVTDNGTLAYTNSGNVTLGNTISGTGVVLAGSTGTLTLTGSNSYSGGTVINSGAVAFTGGAALGSGSVTNNATLAYTGSGSEAFTNAVCGIGALNVAGSGTLAITGSNTVAVSTFVNSGTLQVNGTLTSSDVTVNSGGTLAGTGTLGTATLTSGSTITSGGSNGLTSGTLNVSSLVLNGGSFLWNLQTTDAYDRVNVSGTLDLSALSAANVFTITLKTNATTQWDSTNRNVTQSFTLFTAGNLNQFDASKFILPNIDASVGGFRIGSTNNSILLYYTAAGDPVLLNVDAGLSQNLATADPYQNVFGISSDSVFTPVIKGGNGELVLDGSDGYGGTSTNFGGKLIIGSGTVTVATNVGALGQMTGLAIGSTNAEFTGSNAVLNIAATGFSTGLGVRVSGTGTSSLVNSSGANATLSGPVNLDTNLVISSTSPSGGLLISGVVSGSGALIASGSQTLALTAPNSYAGGTVLNGTTLAVGSSSALGTGTLTAQTPSVLQAGAANLSVGNAVAVTNGSRLTIDAAGNNFAESGAITGQGSVGITNSTGSGTVTLSGTSSYAGGTTVNGGVLNVTTNTALGTGAVTVNAGTLREGVSNALSVPVVAGGNGSLDVNGFAYTVNATNLAGTGTLSVLNNLKTTVSDKSAFAGLLNFGNGTITVTSTGALSNATVAVSGLGTILTNSGVMGSVFVGGNGLSTNSLYGSTGNMNLYASSSSVFTGTVSIAGPSAGKTQWAMNLHASTNVYSGSFYGTTGSAVVAVTNAAALKVGDSFAPTGFVTNAATIVAIDTNSNLITLSTPFTNSTVLTNTYTVSELTVGTNAGYAVFNGAVTASNVVVNGRLDLNGSGALSLGTISGTPNGVTNLAGGGSGIIVYNNTYAGTNALGIKGNLLNFQAGSAFAGYYVTGTTTYQTLTQSGSGTTYFGVFAEGINGQNINTNTQITLSGGNWNFGQIGQNNTGNNYTASAAFNLTNSASVVISGNTGANAGSVWNDHGSWNINDGSMTFLGPVTEGSGSQLGNNPLNLTIASSGTLTLQATNGAYQYMRLGTGINTNGMSPHTLTLNGGIVNLSGLYLGNDYKDTAMVKGVSNDVVSVTINSGTFNNYGPTTVGLNGVTGSTGIQRNVSSTLTLNGGKFLTGGNLDASAPTLLSNNTVTSAFVWNGGQLSASGIVATNANWNGAGSSIAGGTLYNSNGTLAPGDIGVAGRTAIYGSYVQSGSNTMLALDLAGVNAATGFTNGVTNGGSYDTVTVTGSALFSNTTIALNQNWYALGNGAASRFTLVGGSTNLVLNNVGIRWNGGSTGSTLVSPDNAIAITVDHSSNDLVANLSVNQWVNGQGNWGSGGTGVWSRNVDTTNGANSFAAFGSNASAVLDRNETVHALSFLGGNGSVSSVNDAVLTLASADGKGVIINNTTGTNTLSAPVSLQDNLTLIGNGSLNLSGSISGAYGLIAAGYDTATVTNAITLSGSNSYSGGTVVTSGTVTGANANAFGTGGLTITGGTLDLGGYTVTNTLAPVAGGRLTNGTILNNGGTYAFTNSGTVTVAASLAGNNGLVASGTGLTALLGVNTYSGPTYVTNGSLQTAFNPNTVTTVAPGANLIAIINDANGFGWSEANLVSQAAGMSNATLSFDGSGLGYTVSTNIFVSGASSLTLGTYGTGTVTLASGGNYQNSRLWVNGGTLDLGGNTVTNLTGLTISSGNLTNGSIVSSGYRVTNAAYYLNVDGGIITTNYIISANVQQGTSTVSATLGGYLGLTVNNGANGILSLTGPNTNTGPTLVNGGYFRTYLNPNTVITVGTNATLVLPVDNANTGSNSWTDQAIANQGGLMTNTTLALDATGTNYTVPNTLFSGVSNNATLSTYGGAGTLTLAAGGSYAGVSRIMLNGIAPGSVFDLGGNTLTLTNTGIDVNAFNGTLQNGTVIGSGIFRSYVYGSATTTISANLAGSASFLKGADGTTYLSGSNTFTGGLILTNDSPVNPGVYGTLVAVTPTALGNGSVAIAGGTLDLGSNSFNNAGTFTMSGGTITNGSLTLSAYNLSGGTVAANLGAGVANVSLGTVNVTGSLGASSVNIANFGTLKLGSANALANGAAVTMGSPNEVWTVNTLDLGGNSATLAALNSIGAGSNLVIDTVGGSTITLNGNTLFNGSIGGGSSNNAIALNVLSGSVNLGGSNSYTGGTVVNGGDLVLGNGNALGSGSLTVNGGSVNLGGYTVATAGTVLGNGTISNGTIASSLRFNGTAGNVLGAVVANGTTASSVSVNGSGSLTLAASNSYSGGTVVNGGGLVLGNGNALGSGSLTVNGGSVDLGGYTVATTGTVLGNGTISNGTLASGLRFNGTSDNVLGAVVADGTTASSVSVSGTANLTLAASNSYTGGTVVNGGGLVAGNANALGSGSLTVNGGSVDLGGYTVATTGTVLGNGTISNGTLASGVRFNGTSAGTVSATVTDGTAASSVSVNGPGSLTLAGNNSYTGGTAVNGGSLFVGNAGALGNGPVAVAGGTLDLGGNSITNANTFAMSGGAVTNGSINGSVFNLSGGNVGATLTGSVANVSGAVFVSGSLQDANVNLTQGATLTAGSSTALTSASQVTFGSVTETGTVNTLNVAGQSLTLGGLNSVGSGASRIIDTVGGSTLNLTGATAFAGSIGTAGAANFSLSVTGTNQLLGANAYTGATTIGSGAVLDLGTTGSLASTATVNVNGGSLLLGSANQVNANADLNLGGTVSGVVSQSFGSLTLTGNSVIDFSSLVGSAFSVTGAINMNGYSLNVTGWQEGDSFAVAQGYLTVSDLNNIKFFSGIDQTAFTSASVTGLSGEAIVPVPEPSVVVAGLLMVAMMLFAGRRRLTGLLARMA